MPLVRFSRLLASLPALLLFSSPLAGAQQDNTANAFINLAVTPVPGSGHDYIKMLNETVNPANGSVSLRIEAPIPQQRGNVNFPFYVFGYNSGGVSTPSGSLSYAGAFGAVSPTYVVTWSSDANINGIPTPPGLIPGGFVANAAVGKMFWQAGGNSIMFSGPTGTPVVTATCYFNTGYVFVDPQANRHSIPLQWIYQNGNGSATDEGCDPFNVSSFTTAGDPDYQATVNVQQTSQISFSGQLYFTDADGRGQGVEDTNGNVHIPFGQPTIVNNQVTSVAVQGIANPYTFTYGTATRNYTPNSVEVSSSPGAGCDIPADSNDQKTVVTAITLPNSTSSNPQKYTFQYDPTYALLTQVTYPTGAWIQYTWAVNPLSESLGLGPEVAHCNYQHDWPYVQTRTVSFDGTHPALKQTFQYTTTWGTGSQNYLWTQKTTTVTTQDLLRAGQPSFQTVYTYSGFPVYDPMPTMSAQFDGQTPVENSIVYKDWNGSVLKTVTKNWQNTVPPLLLSECTTLPSGLTSGIFYTYGNLSVLTDKKEYDYGTIASNACAQGASAPTTTPARETVITYASFADTPLYPTGPSIFDRPASVQIYGNGTLVAETDYSYDQTGVQGVSPTAYGHDESNFSTGNNTRGNVTTKTVKCLQSSCSNAVSTYTHDETGQVLSMVDPDGNASGGTPSQHTTTYSFVDSWASGDTYTSSVSAPGNMNAYLTQITYPPTSGVSHTESFSYDYPSGQLTVSKDQNGRVTTYAYNDVFARLTQSNYPDGGQTEKVYNDSAPSPTVTTCQLINGTAGATCSATSPATGWKTTLSTMNGVGQLVQTKLASDLDGPTFGATSYDGAGRAYQVYNPTRCNPPTTNCGTETTWGLTTYTYDALGRTTTVAEPDGSSTQTLYDQTCSVNSIAQDGTLVTDEAGNQRLSCNDGLGRMTGVFEAPNVSGYDFPTVYQYDALNDLTGVTQNGSNSSNARVRSFAYDSLARLTSATNPESGTITYTYDPNGNVLTRVAPQADQLGTQQTTTNYTYDALNRLLQLTHTNPPSGGGANAAYAYDGTAISGCPGISVPTLSSPTNLIGRRSAMCSQESTSSFSYDPMGRLIAEARSIGLNTVTTNTTGYKYNLDGSLYQLTYPSGDVVTYTVGGAGRVTQVSDTANNNFVAAPSTAPMYAPHGALAGMTQGSGITTTNIYNDRLQPILLSSGPSSGPVFSVCYDFHLGVAITKTSTDPCQFSAYTTGDNGNVFQVLNNVDSTRSAAYVYDSLNRIAQAYTLNLTSVNCWGETFSPTATAPGVVPSPSSLGIDAWGNLTNRSGVSGMSGSCQTEPFSAAPASTANQLNGYCYDAAGNLLLTSPCPSGSFTPTYWYDAENRMTNPAATYSYFFDADGVRIRKAASATVGTMYWPGPSGEYLMETNGSGTINEEYIYFNGERIARVDRPSGTVHYYFSDKLGSASVITNASGGGATYYYYYPYGGLVATAGSDPNHYKFNGKERDTETGLDMFGARYYDSSLGRFMTPDWAAQPTAVPYANFGNPQSLNLYSYVENNPTTFGDPDGHKMTCTTDANGNMHCVVTPDPPKPKPTPPPQRPDPVKIARSMRNYAYQGTLGALFGAAGRVWHHPAVQGWVMFLVFEGGGAEEEGAEAGAEEGAEAGAEGGEAASEHGAMRMAERDVSPADLANMRTGTKMTQADGATVYVKGLGQGKYDVLVEGEKGVVTVMKNKSGQEVRELGERYGWH
jgi:RHS repeat-associated protein